MVSNTGNTLSVIVRVHLVHPDECTRMITEVTMVTGVMALPMATEVALAQMLLADSSRSE